MALVSASGMGEAVLGFGDGIASEVVSRGQDGGVFASGKTKERVGAKGMRLDVDALPRNNGVVEPTMQKGREEGMIMDVHSRRGDMAVKRSAVVGARLPQPAPLVNGRADYSAYEVVSVYENGLSTELEDARVRERREETAGAVGNRGTVTNGGSHAASSGCSDQLVEMVIQCLDEKVERGNLTQEALELLRLVPEGYIPLPHQVGGHRHVDGKLGFLRRIGLEDILYKPVQPGIKGRTEVQFYESLFSSGELPGEVVSLRDLIPGYYGRHTIQDRAGHFHEFLKLEDITHRFKRPCIMDVKVGRRVWDDFAEQDKIERERKKFPAQETLGYRIIGMRVYQPSAGDYIYYDKWYGRSITESTAMQAVRNFFICGEVNRVDIIPVIIQKLYSFLHWFRTQTSLRLFATSLLIVYEGDCTPKSTAPPSVDIRLVDFAHTYESIVREAVTDDNTLFGLESFTQCLSTLLKNQMK